MHIDWLLIYELSIGALTVSYGIRTVLFLSLHPNDGLEWATTLGSITLFIFFGILLYWLGWSSSLLHPVIYPPLVLASIGCGIASIAFTYHAVRSWIKRRQP